jgi:hypothetical protein
LETNPASSKRVLEEMVLRRYGNTVTPKLNIKRSDVINLNRLRCDFLFKAHLFAHNYVGINDPSCQCGHRSQTTKHLFFNCPIFNDRRLRLLSDIGALSNFDHMFRLSNSIDDRLRVLLHGDS